MPVNQYTVSDRELAALLPGPHYMDPPDGGSVTLLEQLKRMAKDAERYRWLRDKAPRATWDKPVVCKGSRGLGDTETFLGGDELDAETDAAMAAAPAVGAA